MTRTQARTAAAGVIQTRIPDHSGTRHAAGPRARGWARHARGTPARCERANLRCVRNGTACGALGKCSSGHRGEAAVVIAERAAVGGTWACGRSPCDSRQQNKRTAE